MLRRRFAWCLLAVAGCDDWLKDKDPPPTPVTGQDGISLTDLGGITLDYFAGAKIGEACTADAAGNSDCRAYVQCLNGFCATVGDKGEGLYCITNGECAAGLYCSLLGQCSKGGTGTAGQSCSSGADCDPAYHCKAQGFSGTCAPQGTADVRQACASTGDCLAPLQCNTDKGECEAINLAHGWTPWPGAICADVDTVGVARPYFELPRSPPAEFFRLPFPNDAAIRDGKVSLEGFPLPGVGVIGFDPVKRVVDAVEADQKAFSTIPTVVFRFSKAVNWKWLQDNPALHFYNISPGGAGYGQKLGYSWGGNNGTIDNYTCPRVLTVRNERHRPLSPKATYAVFLTKGLPVEGNDAETFAADSDFQTMMGDSAPSDAMGSDAWKAYAPLRAFLDDLTVGHGLSRSQVIVGTVFTVTDTEAVLPAIRTAIQATPTPTPTALTLCDGTAVSPCDDGLSGDAHTRGCFTVSSAAWELHAKVSVPIMQAGTRPYLETGGDVVIGNDGLPVIQGSEDVCISLTVPKSLPMPPSGWPVVFSFHGTGGTFRSSVDGVGLPLADVDVDGAHGGVVTVGMDGPMHGSRRNSDLTPDVLFYNFANPPAARGNLYQGAADVYQIVRAIKGWVVGAAASPTGQELRFDAARLAVMGHSQGSSTGPLAAPYEPDVSLSIWSGAGAGLAYGLVGKVKPVDVKSGLSVALQEYTTAGLREVSADHPVLALIQMYFDPVDPLNHLGHLIGAPYAGGKQQHVLHVYGLGDSYTPVTTQKLFSRVLGVQQVKPVLEDIPAVAVDGPVTGNFAAGAITGLVVQGAPDASYDGHFVTFFNPATQNQFRQFVGSWVVNGVPRGVAP